jgi:methyl-accepting chemotaxis protein-2 (aspartate sensor receptor)
LRAGQRFVGLATLFGKQYITQYDPVRDAAGKVVGVLFIGLDISKNLAMLKDKIRQVRIGQTGYIFIVDAAPGAGYGLVLHPNSEGKSALDFKASDGRPFIRGNAGAEERRPALRTDAERHGRRAQKLSYRSFAPALGHRGRRLQRRDHGRGAPAAQPAGPLRLHRPARLYPAAVLARARALVSRPLAQAEAAAAQIAGGDLTVRLHARSEDEIGRLLHAMNRISGQLSQVVGKVRGSAGQIAAASATSPAATWTCRAARKSRPARWKKRPPRWRN